MENNGGYLTPSGLEGEKSPDYGGKVKVDGKMYWVSGWKSIGQDGREYISLSFKTNAARWGEKKQKAQGADTFMY